MKHYNPSLPRIIMAIQLSPYLAFVNAYVRPLCDAERNKYGHHSRPPLTPRHRTAVANLVKRLDVLHDSHTHKGAPMLEPAKGIMLTNIVVIEDVAFNKKACAEAYEKLFAIVRRYDLPLDFYRTLERAVEANGIPPSDKLSLALACAQQTTERLNARSACYSDRWLNWKERKATFDPDAPAF